MLDFSHVLAGPFCTRLLADLGAEVVRVESTRHPDAPWKSALDPSTGRDVSYVVVSRSKQSVAIDLKTPDGRALAERLATVADVLTENFSAGVMERLGLDYSRLRALNPRLVYVSMSGYGHDGPRRDWTSMNTNLQAYSGLMMVTGREGEPPTAISNSWMDYVGGLHAAFAVVEALAARAESGAGRLIDLAQFECGVATIGPLLLASAVNHAAPPRAGNRSARGAPQGCYPCAGEDAWCAVNVETDAQWAALLEALGKPVWGADPRFGTLLGRRRHHDEIDAHLANWTRTRPTGQVEHRLQAAGVPARRMRRIDEVMRAEDRSGVFQPAGDLAGVDIAMTILPFQMEPNGAAPLASAPSLGEHSGQVLSAWLGLSEAEIGDLRERGVLV